MVLVSSFLVRLSGMLRCADSIKMIRDYLRSGIRSEFVRDFRPESLLKKYHRMSEGSLKVEIPQDEFYDDIVDAVLGIADWQPRTQKDVGDSLQKIRTILVKNLEEQADIDTDQALRIIRPEKVLDDEDQRILDKYKDGFSALLLRYFDTVFRNFSMDWVKYYKDTQTGEALREQRIPEKSVDPHEEVEPDDEGKSDKDMPAIDSDKLEREMLESDEADKDILRGVFKLVRQQPDRKAYLYILQHHFYTKNPRSVAQLAKELGVPQRTMSDKKDKLLGLLRGYYKEKGFSVPETKKIIEEGDIPAAPVYTVVLRDPEKSQSIKKFIPIGPRTGEQTKRVLELLMVGKSIDDIVSELGMNRQVVINTKTRYFDSHYKKWYEEEALKQVQACIRHIAQCLKGLL